MMASGVVPVCEVDLRVGGKWRLANRHPQGDAEFWASGHRLKPR
jgi:uncharacterized protein YndB with AHSA1/START domain